MKRSASNRSNSSGGSASSPKPSPQGGSTAPHKPPRKALPDWPLTKAQSTQPTVSSAQQSVQRSAAKVPKPPRAEFSTRPAQSQSGSSSTPKPLRNPLPDRRPTNARSPQPTATSAQQSVNQTPALQSGFTERYGRIFHDISGKRIRTEPGTVITKVAYQITSFSPLRDLGGVSDYLGTISSLTLSHEQHDGLIKAIKDYVEGKGRDFDRVQRDGDDRKARNAQIAKAALIRKQTRFLTRLEARCRKCNPQKQS